MTETAAKQAKIKRVRVTPSVETNKKVLESCVRYVIVVKKVMEVFNCNRNDAIVLAAAAENGLVPAAKK